MEGKTTNILGIPIRTLSLIVLLIFIALGLLVVALKPSNRKPLITNTLPTISNKISPETVLNISDNPILVSTPSGSFYELDILMSTNQNSANSVQLELSYDPKVLKNIDITSGSFFQNPNVLLKSIDSSNGRISYAISLNGDQSGISGSGIIATLSFSLDRNAQASTQTAISLLPKTEVNAKDYPGSILKSYSGATINISSLIKPRPVLSPAKPASSSSL